MVPMSILLGLCTALFWGTADLFVRTIARRIGSLRAQFCMQFLGLSVLGIYVVVTGELYYLVTHVGLSTWGLAVLSVTLSIAGTFALYRAFEVGKMALVSPITACFAAVTVILSLLSGERLLWMQVVAIVCMLIGILIISASLAGEVKTEKVVRARNVPGLDGFAGVGWALLAAVSYGFAFWILSPVSLQLGGVMPVLLSRVLTPCFLLLGAPLAGQTLKLPRGGIWWLILFASVLETGGFLLYTSGLMQGQVSVVTVLSSLSSVVTVLLAGFILREHLRMIQWLGVCVVIAGVVLINT